MAQLGVSCHEAFYHFLANISADLRAGEIESCIRETLSCQLSRLFPTLDNRKIFIESFLEIIDHRWHEPIICDRQGGQSPFNQS